MLCMRCWSSEPIGWRPARRRRRSSQFIAEVIEYYEAVRWPNGKLEGVMGCFGHRYGKWGRESDHGLSDKRSRYTSTRTCLADDPMHSPMSERVADIVIEIPIR